MTTVATREEIRQIAVGSGWTLHTFGEMDVFVAAELFEEGDFPFPLKPIPPLTFLWQDGKMYRPAGGGMDWDWEESNLHAGEVCGRMDVALYFFHELGFPYAVPSYYQPDQG